MRLAFPVCESQCDTKGQKETFYVGVEQHMASLAPTPGGTIDAQIEMLTARVQELEATVHSHGTTVCGLLIDVQG